MLCINICGQTQQPIKVKTIINLNRSDNFQHKLKECSVLIFENSQKIDSLFVKGHVFKYELENRSSYKIVFTKKGFVSKHIIVNTINYPEKRIKKFKLKADIGLFHFNGNNNIKFLEKEPVSIAYYNEIKKEIMWDFEYNRNIVEKIIHAQIKK
ncbi:MAG: hypothetical protein CL846_10465 [Crocinitomicaceae bacterium]|nr:hypothetical protein [Crocinitomicaceae bacterium]